MSWEPAYQPSLLRLDASAARSSVPASYVVWFDGRIYHADSMNGGNDVTPSNNATTIIQSAISATS